MATDGELEAEVLIKMGEMLDKKLGKAKKPDAENVYLRKTNASSQAFILLNVKILKISETDVVFTCEKELSPGTNLSFSKPVPFFVNVRPSKAQGKVPEYTGLIHCLGEQDKKELRKYINSVFFRDHDAERKVQTDEFKKLNEDKLHQKLESIRIAQEKALAEKEAKEAAEQSKKDDQAAKAADPDPEKREA
jgi:hypothetical protein